MDRGQDLTELLRKCHRDELVPLARLLQIEPEGKKLGVLATAIDKALRRVATNEVANLFQRRGRPTPYLEVLEQIGRRLGQSAAARSEESGQLRLVPHALTEADREERLEPVGQAADHRVVGGQGLGGDGTGLGLPDDREHLAAAHQTQPVREGNGRLLGQFPSDNGVDVQGLTPSASAAAPGPPRRAGPRAGGRSGRRRPGRAPPRP